MRRYRARRLGATDSSRAHGCQRIALLPDVMNGYLDVLVEPLTSNFQAEKLREAVESK